ncbi:unnamed protein product [Sphagnum balticum]
MGSRQHKAGGKGGKSGAKDADEEDLAPHVPFIVQRCIKLVETYGVDTVGIYRVSGNMAAVNALTTLLETEPIDNINFDTDPRWRDVNVVSSLLKVGRFLK